MKIVKRCRGALAVMVVILTIALPSCVKESLPEGGGFGDGYADLTLELIPPGAFSEVQTRALTDDQQNAINRAAVFLFKNGVVVQKVNAEKVENNRMTIKGIKTSQSESDKFDVVVIGNPRSDIDMSDYLGLTKEELRRSDKMGPYYDGRWRGTEFPMWGEVTGVYVHPISNIFQIKMLRALARIDLGVGAYDELTDTWSGLSSFKLSEITLSTLTTLIDIIPKPENIDLNGKAIGVSSSGKVAGLSTIGKYSGADITDQAYIKSTIFLAETESPLLSPVKLIIAGEYNGGATTYYRVDMCLPHATVPGKYVDMDVLRNHLYRITVISVSGPGYATIEEATSSPALNNMTVELTPIDEGGSGDIVFDGHSSISTDASEVLIYGMPSTLANFTLVTVKANFKSGVTTAIITGDGIVSPTGTLVSGSATPIVVNLTDLQIGSTRSYTIEVGKLKKIIKVTMQPPVDAHFDFLPFQDVARITIENPQPWITLSNNITYVKNEQKLDYITGDDKGKAVVHFDENIATTGDPRTAQALVFRRGMIETTRVYFKQLNLSGMVIGYFGGDIGADGYTQQLAVESVEEFYQRVYDDASIGNVRARMPWGFPVTTVATATPEVDNSEHGRLATIAVAKRDDSGIIAPYNIYNNYAGRYCYDKNRDTDGSGTLELSEIVWYLPAHHQLVGIWITHLDTAVPLFTAYTYINATESGVTFCWGSRFDNGRTSAIDKRSNISGDVHVRCVRDI